jgi:Ca2+-binding EF-hand superfamily protein
LLKIRNYFIHKMSVELVRAYLRKQKGSKRRTFISELFRTMDKDKSRELDFTEFKSGLRHLGIDDLSEAEYKNIFNSIDKSKNGKIDFDEFTEMIKGPMATCRAQGINRVFNNI